RVEPVTRRALALLAERLSAAEAPARGAAHDPGVRSITVEALAFDRLDDEAAAEVLAGAVAASLTGTGAEATAWPS
ncbi:MAG: hypothetical protein QOJ39_3245, partial [Candidatus Eremiobacteraeota bacterium]|nr:hypothetical protein [Candidatus Eremiobacteraeota bacterium]